MATILIAESDPRVRSAIRKGLTAQGFSVQVATDGRAACSGARSGRFDLMVLAAELPGCGGFEIVRLLRAEGRSLPIVMLTSRTDVAATAATLHAGADAYVGKPFRFEELLGQVRRRLNPPRPVDHPILTFGKLRLDLKTRRAYVGDYFVDLSVTECALAEMFLRHPGEVLTRERIRRQVWGADNARSNVVDVYIRYLRGKLGPDWIVALRGVGYRLQAA
ncbi:response regulator transcription factor [Mycolicibacterium hippocampi]|uniref:response regulator transcription factor n=1 Tax=Mycolicibacterium hippocampi TaxID=659824 RepID=UPI003515E439